MTDRIVGIVKAYTTRVGSGPFPTELFDENGDFLRSRGFEFGTTTGRPRRVGWYDAPITRYATRLNGITDLVLTKLDILTGLEQVPVSGRARSRPSCSTRTATSSARAASSSARRPAAPAVSAGTTPRSRGTRRASTASPTSC